MSDATTAQDVTLVAPVRRVTLLEDRAQVTREGSVELGAGSHRLRISEVAPVAYDRSLVARVGDGARVDEARIVRRWRVGASDLPPAAAEAFLAREEVDRALQQVASEQALIKERLALAEQALDLTVAGLDRELPYAEAFEDRWVQAFADFTGQVRAAHDDLSAATAREEELDGQLRAAASATLTAPHVWALEATFELEVTVREPGTYAFTVDYMVPCALWRPIHRATLRGGAVAFECEAAVWQATGEPWEEVELSFSTARPTQRAEPPVLSDDRLRAQRRREKTIQVDVREEAIANTGEGQAQVTSDLPGVDDGGETRTLGAAQTVSIPSAGSLHRVPVFTLDAEAEVDRICCPELGPLVHLRSRQTNTSAYPLLAGPLELARESGTVGRGEVGFVAPGEHFVLGWGADDAVRVQRQVRETSKEGFLGRKRTKTRTVTLYLSNLEPIPVSFRLEERVPVSEVEDVEISVDAEKTRPRAAPNEQGIVAWEVTLPPGGRDELRLVYQITASKDIRGI